MVEAAAAVQSPEDLGYTLVVDGQTLRACEQRQVHPRLWSMTVTLGAACRVDLEQEENGVGSEGPGGE